MLEEEKKVKKEKSITVLTSTLDKIGKIISELDNKGTLDKVSQIVSTIESLNKTNILDKLSKLLSDMPNIDKKSDDAFVKLNLILEALSKINIESKSNIDISKNIINGLSEIRDSINELVGNLEK